MGRYAVCISKEMGLSEDDCKEIEISSILHDIGKIGVGDTVLRKVGGLDERERREIEKHPPMGGGIVDAYDAMRSERPYRGALPKEVAVQEMLKYSGRQFDPVVMNAFLKVLEKHAID